MGISGQVFDDHQLHLTQFLVGAVVVLRECLDAVVADGTLLQQGLHVGEERLFLVHHVPPYLAGILVVELQDELSEVVGGIDALLELTAYEGQLEVEVILVAGLEVVHEGGHGELVVVLADAIPIYCEIHHGEEGVGIDAVHLTGLTHGLVAETEVDSERTERLENVVIVLDERDHLVVGLIKFHLFHH